MLIELLSYLSIGFICFQLVNVSLNALFPQKIREHKGDLKQKISVLIPARNEAHNIGGLLDDLSTLNNQNIEIIVLDDHSTDDTAKIVTGYTAQDPRVKLVPSKNLPIGWLGKNHACHQLSEIARGDYYLFLDADVRLSPHIIPEVTAFLIKNKLDLLSIFPKQIQHTLGEKLTVPLMNYILLTLLPLVFVRHSPFTAHAAANGQFMLFDALSYKKTHPHKLFRDAPVEDIKIARHFKKERLKVACLTMEQRTQCRMYRNYQEAIQGFSKNIFTFFGGWFGFAFLFWGLALFGFIPVWIAHSDYMLLYGSAFIYIQILYTRLSHQQLRHTFLFPLQMFCLLQIMVSSLRHKRKNLYLWKERNIYT